MSEEERNILVLAIFPLVLLLIGIIMMWSILGPQTLVGFKALLSVKMTIFLVLFAVAGLIFGQPGLKAMSKYMPYSEQVPAGSEIRRKSLIAIVTLVLGILFCAFVPAFPDLSNRSLAETALRLIVTGLGFSVMFGTLLVCASIIRIKSQRDS